MYNVWRRPHGIHEVLSANLPHVCMYTPRHKLKRSRVGSGRVESSRVETSRAGGEQGSSTPP